MTGLRDATRRTWRIPTATVTAHDLPRTVRRLENRWADVEPKRPQPFELAAILKRVSETWSQSRSIDQLKRADARWLPYLLFFPADKPDSWLLNDAGFVDQFLHWLASSRPRAFVATLKEFIRRYPHGTPAFEPIRNGLKWGLPRRTGLRLVKWLQRSEEHRLLEQDGPRTVAQAIRSGASAPATLESAGLDGDLGASEFVRHVTRDYLAEISAALPEMEAAELRRGLEFVTLNGRLRFGDEPERVAEALLKPWAQRQPSSKQREIIVAFLLAHLQDPRIKSASWIKVSKTARAVITRWLVESSLDDFFRLLERSALDAHWKYRKQFWKKWLDKGLLSDAWPVLGEAAREDARRLWGADAIHFARLHGSSDQNHSVLLMRVGHLTIADWSHNGKCRMWVPQNADCPEFYQPLYTRAELMRGADEEFVHHNSDKHGWQSKVANYIAHETGQKYW